jgi:bifunctional non-homologous end joining protein LigD
MADQLSLGFDPALPRATAVTPMWPVPRRQPFDSGDHLFEPAWGGHRVLAFLEPGGGLRIVDGAGTELTTRVSELDGLRRLVDAKTAILDGELVAVDAHGWTDHDALAERLAGRPGRPLSLLAFDLLHHNGAWLLGRPLEVRRTLLRKVVADGDSLVVVPAVAGEGTALFAAVASQGISGVLARERTSPYLPGVRSRLWRSIAVRAADADPDADPDAAPLSEDEPERPAAPVLTVLRRLPLDFD